ncbi:transcriptional-regulating factor 1 isoform X2 [Lepisosteus oculatus]|uniref:transcriptional-regulating factor 1 isoform X2 n=1 Tax=Lepisosteus oculatus TaxID=7918 RepID=UPI0035F527DD
MGDQDILEGRGSELGNTPDGGLYYPGSEGSSGLGHPSFCPTSLDQFPSESISCASRETGLPYGWGPLPGEPHPNPSHSAPQNGVYRASGRYPAPHPSPAPLQSPLGAQGARPPVQKLDSFSEAFAGRRGLAAPGGGGGGAFGGAGGPPQGLGATGKRAPFAGPVQSPPAYAQVQFGFPRAAPFRAAPFCPGLQPLAGHYQPPPPQARSPLNPVRLPPLPWTPHLAGHPEGLLAGGQATTSSFAGAAQGRAPAGYYPPAPERDAGGPPFAEEQHEFGQPSLLRGHAAPDCYQSPDCGLQIPLSSSPGQYPQSCAAFRAEDDPLTCDPGMWGQERERNRAAQYPQPPLAPQDSGPYPLTPGYRPGECASAGLGSPQGLGAQYTRESQELPVYTGTPFPSLLHIARPPAPELGAPRYTPQPMLNPVRRGSGLYCGLLPPSPYGHQESLGSEEPGCYTQYPHVNVGPGFQAELPDVQELGGAEEELPRAELLWQPWPELQESAALQEHVDAVLSLSCSSAVPGGGTNPELALHCLSRCRGDILATLEMLLLSTPQAPSSYHYCGSDVWGLSERRLFNKAFAAHSKDFSLIQRAVKTKRVSQCVEFYYLSKKTLQHQRKERDRDGEWTAAPIMLESPVSAQVFPSSQPIESQLVGERAVPSPSVAGSFPCKQCGKMFYKIKSRNAHMKIHRQQEDWRDRDRERVALAIESPNPTAGTTSSGVGPPLSRPGASLALYSSTWDCREFLEQLDLTSDPLSCAVLPPSFFCDPEGKMGMGKPKYGGNNIL